MCKCVQNLKIIIFHIYFFNMDISLIIALICLEICTIFPRSVRRYPCSKNKSENIGYKFAIFAISGIPPCVLYHWIGKKAGHFLMYCLSFYLIQIQSYRSFSNMAVDHWCLSLMCTTCRCTEPYHIERYPEEGVLFTETCRLFHIIVELYSKYLNK